MGDDPLSRFTNRIRPQAQPSASPPAKPPSAPARVVSRDARQPYEAFENQVRTPTVEIRCFSTGLSYSLPYAHIGAIVFEFMTGRKLMFTGCGHAVTINGRNLRPIVLALNLHTCGYIQDFHPEAFILPQPEDPAAPFVESIKVDVLHGPKALSKNE